MRVKVAQYNRLAHVLVALALHRAEARLRLDELRRHRAIALAQQLALRGDAELLALGGDAAAPLLVHVEFGDGESVVVRANALPVCSAKRSAAVWSRRAQSVCGRPAEDLLEPVLLFASHRVCVFGWASRQATEQFTPRCGLAVNSVLTESC